MLKKKLLLNVIVIINILILFLTGCGDNTSNYVIPTPTANAGTSTIKGTVYDNNGQPLDGASVLLIPATVTGSENYGEIQEYITQNGGQYIFTVSYSGTYRIEAREGETILESKEFIVVAGADSTINLGSQSTDLTVYIWEDINQNVPAENYTITLKRSIINSSNIISLDSEGEGWSKFEDLTPGDYTITVSHEDLGNEIEKSVQISEGENTENINLIGWHSPKVIAGTSYLLSIHFTDTQNGWAVGRSTDTRGVITKTTDGGYNWSTSRKINETQELRSVYFTDSQNGWAAGYNDSYRGIIIKTTDGGNNWTTPQVINDTYSLYSIYFTDSLNGWAVGNNSSFEGVVTKTADGGNTWTTPEVITGSSILRSIYFTDSRNGWAVGNNSSFEGVVTKTTDGGNTWSTAQVITEYERLYSVYFTDSQNGWAAGYTMGFEGIISKTADGGNTWTSQVFAGTQNFNSVYFTDNQNGYVLHLYPTGLLKTTDGGSNWSDPVFSEESLSNSAFYIDENNIWTAGNTNKGEGTVMQYAPLSP